MLTSSALFRRAGNFYSIINESATQDARLFFSQGCQWNGEMDEAALAAAAAAAE